MGTLEQIRFLAAVDLLHFCRAELVPARKLLGITQKKMLERMGLLIGPDYPNKQPWLSRIEQGQAPKTYAEAQLIADNYGLTEEQKERWYALIFGSKKREMDWESKESNGD